MNIDENLSSFHTSTFHLLLSSYNLQNNYKISNYLIHYKNKYVIARRKEKEQFNQKILRSSQLFIYSDIVPTSYQNYYCPFKKWTFTFGTFLYNFILFSLKSLQVYLYNLIPIHTSQKLASRYSNQRGII